ncbi:MAG: YetF domain-containing protein [Ilumatobacteraceae bacterium]
MHNWLMSTWTDLGLIVVSAVLILMWLVGVIRVVGLRSLSKMSSFDFAVTVALGSILAAGASSSVPIVNAALAIVSLLTFQALIAMLRQRTRLSDVVDNEPLLIMANGVFVDEALRSSRVTRSDVYAKLREANVVDLEQALAVVLESTGDVSVLHGHGPLDPRVLDGVRIPDGAEALVHLATQRS